MANFLESFLLPTATQYRTQAEAEGRKIQSFGEAMQRLRGFLNNEEKQGIANAIEVLARRGQLNSNSLAQVVAALGQKKLAVLGEAQMTADAAREAARQQQKLLGDYAKTAMVGDIAKLGMQAGSIALGGWAAGAPLAVAGQAAQKGAMTAGQKMALSGVASALSGNAGYLDLAKQQIAEPGIAARAKEDREWWERILAQQYPDMFPAKTVAIPTYGVDVGDTRKHRGERY